MTERFDIRVRQDEIDEVYRQHRERWVHEDGLINQRLTWFTAAQSLLIAGYGITFQAQNSDFIKRYSDHLDLFLSLIPWVGLLSSALVFLGIFAACAAMHYIQSDRASEIAQIQSKRGSPEDRLGSSRHLACFGVRTWTTYLGMLTSLGMPMVFIVLWTLMMTLGTPKQLAATPPEKPVASSPTQR